LSRTRVYDCDPSNRFRHPCTPAHGALAKNERTNERTNERKKEGKKIAMPPSKPTSWLGAVAPRAGQLPPRGIVVRYKAPRAPYPHLHTAICPYKNNCGNCYVGSATGRSRRMKAAANHHVEGNLSHRSAMIGVLWHSSRTRHTPTPHLPITTPFRQANLTCDAYSCRRPQVMECARLRLDSCQRLTTCSTTQTAEAYLLRLRVRSCQYPSVSPSLPSH